MAKVTVRVGNYDSSQKDITFSGELIASYQEFEVPKDQSIGTQYDLYKVRRGYRVFEKRWTNGGGAKRQNYAKLSKVLTKAELLEKFALVANYAGIFETVNFDDLNE
jgi:hypothetical protein